MGRRRKSKRQKKVKMCVRYTLLIANSLLALLGLLLLAGGVWRIVDSESLREVAREIKDTQEWDDVKKGVDGLEDAVKEASSHKYFNYALPLQHLRLHHPPPPDRCHRLHQLRRR